MPSAISQQDAHLADPVETTKYNLLQGTKYQRYLDLRERLATGKPVSNPHYISDLVSDIGENIRFLGDVPSTSKDYAKIRATQQQLRSLRNELIGYRNQLGIKPENEPPPPKPLPLEQQPIRTPFGVFSPDNTPFQQYDRRSGPLYESRERGLAKFQRENPPGVIESPPEETGLTEIRLYSYPAASPIDLGESFVTGLNVQFEGRQVLIGKREGDTYTVEYNPALSRSGFVDELVEERLTSYGYSKKDGKFVYTDPSYEFTYGEPEYGEVEPEQFDFTVPVEKKAAQGMEISDESFDFTTPFYSDAYKLKSPSSQREGFVGFSPEEISSIESSLLKEGKFAAEDPQSGQIYVLGGKEEQFFSPDTPIREFFRRDVSGELESGIRSFEDQTGAYIKESPIGEIRFSQGVGFVGESIEDYVVKPLAATGVVAAGTFKAAYAPDEKTRVVAAGDVYAAYPSFVNLPFAVATIATLIYSPSAALGKEASRSAMIRDSPKTVEVSSRVVGSELLRTFRLPSGSMIESVKPLAGSEVFIQTGISAAKSGARAVQGILEPAMKIVSSTAKGAFLFGTIQGGLEFGIGALQSGDLSGGIERLEDPEVQTRIKAAAIGGGIVGGGITAAKTFGPQTSGFVQAKAKPYSDTIKGFGFAVRELPRTALEGTSLFTSTLVLTSGAGGATARTLQGELAPGMERPASFRLAAKVTEAGANPFSPELKSALGGSRTRVRQLPKPEKFGFSIIPTAAKSTGTLSPNASPALREALRAGIAADSGIIREGTFQAPRTRQMENIGVGVGVRARTRIAIRQEAIERDILSERGRLRVEQFALLREGSKQGLRTGQSEREGFFIGQLELTRAPKNLRFPEQELVKIGLKQLVPEKPGIDVPGAFIDLSTDFQPRRRRRDKRQDELSFRRAYSPSVAGVSLGVRASRTKGSFGGFEIRGLPGKRGRK